jgi:hypothetical protein
MEQFNINGVIVKTSHLGKSGYHGACFSPAWTLDKSRPFVAAVTNPTEQQLVSLLTAKERTALHLGYYSDSREAAYVVAYYKANKQEVLENMQSFGENRIIIPDAVYTMPEYISLDDAKAEIQKVADAKKMGKKNTRFKVTSTTVLNAVIEAFKDAKVDPKNVRGVASKARAYLEAKSHANSFEELVCEAAQQILILDEK